MARYGLLADVHGNYEALEAVLAHLRARGVERYACLGDIVGYNADAERCVALVRGHGMEAVAGNHDLIAIGRLGFERCGRRPAHALRRTREVLREAGFSEAEIERLQRRNAVRCAGDERRLEAMA